LEHFPKEIKTPSAAISHGIIETLDDNIVEIKFIPRSRKQNALEVMFEFHSMLMSFESENTMKRWAEELKRIASKYSPCE